MKKSVNFRLVLLDTSAGSQNGRFATTEADDADFQHKTRLAKGEEIRISGVRVGPPPFVYRERSMFVAAAQLFLPNGDRCSFAHLIVIAVAAAGAARATPPLVYCE